MQPALSDMTAPPTQASRGDGSSCSTVATMQQRTGRGHFCARLHAFLADKTYKDAGGWCADGTALVIQNPEAFAAQLERAGLGSGSFANIRRQLHNYKFSKCNRSLPQPLAMLLLTLAPGTQCWIHPNFRRDSPLIEVQAVARKPYQAPSKAKSRQITPPVENNFEKFRLPPLVTPAPEATPHLYDPLNSSGPDLYETASSCGGTASESEGNDDASVDEGYGRCFKNLSAPHTLDGAEGFTFGSQPWTSNSVDEPLTLDLEESLSTLGEVEIAEGESNVAAEDWNMPWVNSYHDRVVHYSNAYPTGLNQHELAQPVEFSNYWYHEPVWQQPTTTTEFTQYSGLYDGVNGR